MFSFVEQHHMIDPHDCIVLGVSGGADSVCLLFVLLEYAKKIPFELSVVHVDHGLRPDAAEDARYVEELCMEHGIPFYLTKADVKGYASREKCSEEDAGRRIRYEAFRKAAGESGANKTAVAHNRNDRAETMLFHLFRGSGLKGLCGILPVRQDIIRPLLCLEREEIENYLTERQIVWRTDNTNGSDEYARNRIRRNVLPYVERELVQGCVGHMAQTADILMETEHYIQQQTLAAKAECVKPGEEGFEISAGLFGKQHPAIQKRLLLLLAEELSPTGKDISAIHIRELISLFEAGRNRSVDLPMGICGVRSYGNVYLEKRRERGRESFHFLVSKEDMIGKKSISFVIGRQGTLEFTLFLKSQCEEVPKNQCTKWFNYDKIEKSLSIRSRESSDFLSIADGKGGIVHKSVKEHMIAQKIPRKDRDNIPLLAEGHHVLWIVGGRASEYYKADENTQRILQVQLKGNCDGSKTEDENGRAY